MPTEVKVTGIDHDTIPNMVILTLEDPHSFSDPQETHGYYELPVQARPAIGFGPEPISRARTPYTLAFSFGLRTGAIKSLAIPSGRLLSRNVAAQYTVACLIGEDAVRRLARGEELKSITITEANRANLARLLELHKTTWHIIQEVFCGKFGRPLRNLADD